MIYDRDIKKNFIKYLRHGASYTKMIKYELENLISIWCEVDWINTKVITLIPALLYLICLIILTFLTMVYIITLLPIKSLRRKYKLYKVRKIFKEFGFYETIRKFKKYEFNIT